MKNINSKDKNGRNAESPIKSISELTNEKLIELFIENNCSLSKLNKLFGVGKSRFEREFKKRDIDYRKIHNEYKDNERLNYSKNPNKCQHCGKELDWEHRNNKYCSKSCAASNNNKGVIRNKKGNSKNLKKYNRRRNSNKDDITNKKASVKKSQEVKEKNKDKRKAKRFNNSVDTIYYKYGLVNHIKPGCCPICGRYHCNDKFCKNCSLQLLLNLVKHVGFDPTTISTKNVKIEFNRVREMIYTLYWEEKLSTVDLGIKFNYSEGRIPTNIIKFLNIPLRNRSDAGQNMISVGKGNLSNLDNIRSIFKHEIHITWENQKVYLRSSYETDYANKLDNLNISYLVESLRIEYYDSILKKTRIAIPDFYLPDTKEIVEIKSDFTLDIQEMLDKFDAYKKLGYIPKLILEHEEVDIYNLDKILPQKRLNKIRNGNIKRLTSNNSQNP